MQRTFVSPTGDKPDVAPDRSDGRFPGGRGHRWLSNGHCCLEEMAGAIGVPAEAFRRTVDTYNAACVDGRFDPYRVDGPSTEGAALPKPNWARPILKLPFRGYPIIGSNTFTFGGLKVTPDAQVLNTSGALIPGLYAAGETIGIYYGVYCSATSVHRGAVFGRRAGQHAGKAHG